MLLLILLLISNMNTCLSYTAIMTLHFHSFGLDLSKIDCVHPFGNEHNRVPPIRTEDDCQIYIRACSFGPNNTSSCLRTASYSFMHNYTGGLAFSLEDKTKKSRAKIQFRSSDLELDTYLTQNHDYLIEVRSGNVINNNTLKSANLRGSVQAMINCGEGFDLDFTKYFCQIDPHPLPFVEVHEVVETDEGPIVTTMLVEKEDLHQVPVEFIPVTTALPSPPPLVLVPPLAMQPQQERLIHCKDESCGSWIIYVVIIDIFFLFILSAAVFCFVAKRSRDPSRRLHESTPVHSIRSRTSRSSVLNSPV